MTLQICSLGASQQARSCLHVRRAAGMSPPEQKCSYARRPLLELRTCDSAAESRAESCARRGRAAVPSARPGLLARGARSRTPASGAAAQSESDGPPPRDSRVGRGPGVRPGAWPAAAMTPSRSLETAARGRSELCIGTRPALIRGGGETAGYNRQSGSETSATSASSGVVSRRPPNCKRKSSSIGAVDRTAGTGATEQSRRTA
jgi:hypothetical protein